MPKLFKLLKFSIAMITLVLLMFSRSTLSGEHTAHVHGQARLTIAFEQNRINFNLTTPAATLFGFEHSPTSFNERAIVSSSKIYLSQFSNILQFNNTDCKTNDIDIAIGATDTKNHPNYGHKHGHEHGDEQENKHSQASSHQEVEVSYELSCQSTENIASASVQLFKQYPTLEKIHVIWLGHYQQGSVLLNPNNTKINFQ